jgi:signal peptidase I
MILIGKGLCTGIGILILLRYFLLVVEIEQDSMLPALAPGDRVLVLRHWPAHWLRNGQVIILSRPRINYLFIKRIVALPGETYDASTLKCNTEEQRMLQTEARRWTIPTGFCFVRGDNIGASTDSCNWGPIPFSDLVGIVIFSLPRRIPSRNIS